MKQTMLRKTAAEFTKGILDKCDDEPECVVVCEPLQEFLGLQGVHTKLVRGYFLVDNEKVPYYWLELLDGRILDPTADQLFEKYRFPFLPRPYFGPLPFWYPIDRQYV